MKPLDTQSPAHDSNANAPGMFGAEPDRPARVVSGAELRRRLITPEVLAAMTAPEDKPSFLQRLFRRK